MKYRFKYKKVLPLGNIYDIFGKISLNNFRPDVLSYILFEFQRIATINEISYLVESSDELELQKPFDKE